MGVFFTFRNSALNQGSGEAVLHATRMPADLMNQPVLPRARSGKFHLHSEFLRFRAPKVLKALRIALLGLIAVFSSLSACAQQSMPPVDPGERKQGIKALTAEGLAEVYRPPLLLDVARDDQRWSELVGPDHMGPIVGHARIRLLKKAEAFSAPELTDNPPLVLRWDKKEITVRDIGGIERVIRRLNSALKGEVPTFKLILPNGTEEADIFLLNIDSSADQIGCIEAAKYELLGTHLCGMTPNAVLIPTDMELAEWSKASGVEERLKKAEGMERMLYAARVFKPRFFYFNLGMRNPHMKSFRAWLPEGRTFFKMALMAPYAFYRTTVEGGVFYEDNTIKKAFCYINPRFAIYQRNWIITECLLRSLGIFGEIETCESGLLSRRANQDALPPYKGIGECDIEAIHILYALKKENEQKNEILQSGIEMLLQDRY